MYNGFMLGIVNILWNEEVWFSSGWSILVGVK